MTKPKTKREESSDGLTQNTTASGATEKHPSQAERKATFTVLYRLVNASLYRGRTSDSLQSAEFQQVNRQTEEALLAVTQAIHGEPNSWQYAQLCELCFLRYAEHFAKEGGKALSTWCCSPCYQRLEAQGTRMKEVSHGGQQ